MLWIPVMRLPDGTAIDMQLPTTNTHDNPDLHRYRVRGPANLIDEFGSLPEIAAHLRRRCRPDIFDELIDGSPDRPSPSPRAENPHTGPDRTSKPAASTPA